MPRLGDVEVVDLVPEVEFVTVVRDVVSDALDLGAYSLIRRGP